MPDLQPNIERQKIAESGTLKACVDIFTSTKVAKHTLAALEKIVAPVVAVAENQKEPIPF